VAVDAYGNPIRELVTEGTRADCKEAENLIESFEAVCLIADKGYDTSAILAMAVERNMEVVIPPKKNHLVQWGYDKRLLNNAHALQLI
jgi:transposase